MRQCKWCCEDRLCYQCARRKSERDLMFTGSRAAIIITLSLIILMGILFMVRGS